MLIKYYHASACWFLFIFALQTMKRKYIDAYIRIVRLIYFCLLLPLAVQAKREKVDMPDKPMVSDSILQCIFQFSPFYSRIIDEYKADLYIKEKIKVHKRNHLIRFVNRPCFVSKKHINDYLMESLSELHYTALIYTTVR